MGPFHTVISLNMSNNGQRTSLLIFSLLLNNQVWFTIVSKKPMLSDCGTVFTVKLTWPAFPFNVNASYTNTVFQKWRGEKAFNCKLYSVLCSSERCLHSFTRVQSCIVNHYSYLSTESSLNNESFWYPLTKMIFIQWQQTLKIKAVKC